LVQVLDGRGPGSGNPRDAANIRGRDRKVRVPDMQTVATASDIPAAGPEAAADKALRATDIGRCLPVRADSH